MPKRLEIALPVIKETIKVIKNFLNPEGHQNPISGLKVTAILLKGFSLLVEHHREGSAPAACAAGLFNTHLQGLNVQSTDYKMIP